MFADKLGGAGALTLLTVLLVRWCTSLHSYSGEGKPPMFGDYEAQRHWMELTFNLPVEEWYFNSTSNDLLYWGLDYPPLTAYHMKLCGHIAAVLDKSFVALGTSHGYESVIHKLFMRTTVIVADLLVLIPAVWIYFNVTPSLKPKNKAVKTSEENFRVWTFLALMYPGLILIDHGHFQYNGVSLGLAVAAVAALMKEKDLLASVLFVLALSYKQMSLYYALPFFFYLLGRCLRKGLKKGMLHLTAISFVVLTTFAIVWFPFITDMDQLIQVLHRLFPLARGVFEDKVSNVWCAVNVVYKLRNSFTNEQVAKLCLVTTLLCNLPSCFNIGLWPEVKKFPLALINSSLAFFLFSFQVHEKSILLAAMAVVLHSPSDPFACIWFLNIATFSMLPLLLKDGLLLPTLALSVFHLVAAQLMVNVHPNTQNETIPSNRLLGRSSIISVWWQAAFLISLTGCICLTVASVVIKPPNRLPDLFPLLVSVYSFVHFVLFFLFFNYKQLQSNKSVMVNTHIKIQ